MYAYPPAAGEDFTLSNSHSNIATVTFLPFQDDSSTFRIMLRCDRILEGPEICIIRVRNVSIPKGAPVTDGGPDSRPSVTLTIDNCPGVEGNHASNSQGKESM